MTDDPKNPKTYVSVELCGAKHESLERDLHRLKDDVEEVKKALIGEDMQSGLVEAVQKLTNKVETITHSSLNGKDKAAVVIAIISAITAVIIAFLK